MITHTLPCPGCGITPDIADPDFCYPVGRRDDLWAAHCTAHGSGCGWSVLGDTRDGAIDRWNTRKKSD